MALSVHSWHSIRLSAYGCGAAAVIGLLAESRHDGGTASGRALALSLALTLTVSNKGTGQQLWIGQPRPSP